MLKHVSVLPKSIRKLIREVNLYLMFNLSIIFWKNSVRYIVINFSYITNSLVLILWVEFGKEFSDSKVMSVILMQNKNLISIDLFNYIIVFCYLRFLIELDLLILTLKARDLNTLIFELNLYFFFRIRSILTNNNTTCDLKFIWKIHTIRIGRWKFKTLVYFKRSPQKWFCAEVWFGSYTIIFIVIF